GKYLGLVSPDPAQLGGDDLLRDTIAGAGEEALAIDLARQLLDLGAAAPVALLHAAAQEIALSIQQHNRRHHAGDADAGEGAGERRLSGKQLPHDRAGVAPPLFRILLRPAGMEREKVDRTRGDGDDALRQVNQDADGRGRADIDADDRGHADASAQTLD